MLLVEHGTHGIIYGMPLVNFMVQNLSMLVLRRFVRSIENGFWIGSI